MASVCKAPSTFIPSITVGDETRKRIANVLNIRAYDKWRVLAQDSFNRLFMVSREVTQRDDGINVNRPKESLENIKGVIVHLGETSDDDYVLVNNYTFTPTANSDRLTLDDNSQIAIPTIYGNTMTFDPANTTIAAFHEGFVIRLFKFNGLTYFSTSSKFNAEKGHWGNRTFGPADKTFYDMFIELGGVPPEEFFPSDEATHPLVYVLLVCAPEMQMASLNDSPKIVLLGVYTLGTATERPRLTDTVVPGFESLQKLTVAEGEHYLAFGTSNNEVSSDPRLRTGEALILTQRLPDGTTTALKVESTAYAYRMAVRQNEPNSYKRWVDVMVSCQQLNPDAYQVSWPILVENADISTPWGRVMNAFYVFVESHPLSQREYAYSLLPRLFGLHDTYAQSPVLGCYRAEGQPGDIHNSYGELIFLSAYLNEMIAQFERGIVNASQLATMNRRHTLRALRLIQNLRQPGVSFPIQDQQIIHTMLFQPYANVVIPGMYSLFGEMRGYYRNLTKEFPVVRDPNAFSFKSSDFPALVRKS